MNITLYEVNAFTNRDFSSNPAAVCVLDHFLPDEIMQAIAAQNNLPETAFLVHEGGDIYRIRWFAPNAEVGLVGHATLAASYVIFNEVNKSLTSIKYNSNSGQLNAERNNSKITLNFPASMPEQLNVIPEYISNAIDVEPQQVLGSMDYIVVLKDEQQIANLIVDMNQLALLDRRGVVFTAKGDTVDFVSRVFHPKLGIGEDPVCGSAHCQLAPYWSAILKKNTFHAKQLSSRGGELYCELVNDRVLLSGECRLYLKGEISISAESMALAE